eukprot:TRINITY_DN5786_c0_g1_i7.p1 TRINITY_DN5786_c0_g1~~TRINITY_DN5786_c0_g1_i7.p1  ORF type:complete len:230 (-),score=43.26 TRINITY_DN5786_c0_g1_i7:49-738(-)
MEKSAQPSNISHKEAAGLPLAGLTSYQALKSYGQVKEGQRVLVLGGAGGTGSLGIQIAKALGAHVTTTSSDARFVTSIGADRVINYREADWGEELKGQNFDCIYDTVGGYESWVKAKQVLKQGGHYVTIAGDVQAALSIKKLLSNGLSIANRKFWGWLGYHKYDLVVTNTNHKDLQALTDMVEAGKVRPLIDSEFKLEQISGAFARMMSGRAHGKVTVVVRDENEEKKE